MPNFELWHFCRKWTMCGFFLRTHNKQRLLPYTTLADWFCITEVESVYCAVRTVSLYKKDTFSLLKG